MPKDDPGSKDKTSAPTKKDLSKDTDKSTDTFTRSEVDKLITEALATREKNLKVELDTQKIHEVEEQKRNKLLSDGKFEDLVKHQNDELTKLREEIAAKERNEEVRRVFKDEGIESLSEVLLNGLTNSASIKEAATAIKVLFSSEVQKQVETQLGTGIRGYGEKGAGAGKAKSKLPDSSKKTSDMSLKEKVDYMKENGQEAWSKKLDAEYASQ